MQFVFILSKQDGKEPDPAHVEWRYDLSSWLHDHEQFRYEFAMSNPPTYGDGDDGTAIANISITNATLNNWMTDLAIAMRCVQPNGLLDEIPAVEASVASIAQDIIQRPDQYDAGQLDIARKVYGILGDQAPPAIDVDPTPVSVPINGKTTVNVTVYPTSGEQSFTAEIGDTSIATISQQESTAKRLTLPRLVAPVIHPTETVDDTADTSIPFPFTGEETTHGR